MAAKRSDIVSLFLLSNRKDDRPSGAEARG